MFQIFHIKFVVVFFLLVVGVLNKYIQSNPGKMLWFIFQLILYSQKMDFIFFIVSTNNKTTEKKTWIFSTHSLSLHLCWGENKYKKNPIRPPQKTRFQNPSLFFVSVCVSKWCKKHKKIEFLSHFNTLAALSPLSAQTCVSLERIRQHKSAMTLNTTHFSFSCGH